MLYSTLAKFSHVIGEVSFWMPLSDPRLEVKARDELERPPATRPSWILLCQPPGEIPANNYPTRSRRWTATTLYSAPNYQAGKLPAVPASELLVLGSFPILTTAGLVNNRIIRNWKLRGSANSHLERSRSLVSRSLKGVHCH